MKTKKEYWKWNINHGKTLYCVCYQVLDDNDKVFSKFKDLRQFYEPDTEYIDINKLNSVKFLEDNNIEYIIEGKEDKNIIPVGIIDFTKTKDYYSGELSIFNFDNVDLHKSNQIMKNIERAIELRYEAVKFVQKFGKDCRVEIIECK
ncbi:hypothetical protein [Lutispora sp.]|uniref:hypothetical protein n=1 Tax=Lutispora sp. TaxID=2828727 RepID=UPI003561404F